MWNCIFQTGLTNFKSTQIKVLSKQFTQPNTLARVLVPSLPFAAFNNYLTKEQPATFLIVRHPYERLLSAYRDKFENKRKYYHKHYGQFIIKNYRKKGIRRFGRDFYTRISNDANKTDIPPYRSAAIRNGKDVTPTFWEFIMAIIQQGISDDHWHPAHMLCSLCRVSKPTTV